MLKKVQNRYFRKNIMKIKNAPVFSHIPTYNVEVDQIFLFNFLNFTNTKDEKITVPRTIWRHVGKTMCRPDPENLLVRMGAKDMALDASDLIVSSLSRTFSSLYKTKQKVSQFKSNTLVASSLIFICNYLIILTFVLLRNMFEDWETNRFLSP